MANESPQEYLSISSKLELKRIHQTPPPFSILKSIINSKLKKPHEVLRMSTAQLVRAVSKRAEPSLKLDDKLKIVGYSNQYNRYFETQSKPLTSQMPTRKTTVSITRQSIRKKNDYCSTPKHSMQDFHKFCSKQDVELDPILYRNSAKLSILFKQKQTKQKSILLILSVEFLMMENKFWKEDEIDEDVVRHWKKLQSVCNIIWIAKKEKSLKKMQGFAERMGVSLDTVYLLKKPKKKRVITINLKLIELEVNVRSYQKILYIDGLNRNHSTQRNNEHYLCKLPVTLIINISINMIQTQQPLKLFFHNIHHIMYKESTHNLDVSPILDSYNTYLSKMSVQKSRNSILKPKPKSQEEEGQGDGDEYTEMLQRIDELKGTWIKDIANRFRTQNKGRQFQRESIPYCIGDLLKRNFTILSELHVEQKKFNPICQPEADVETHLDLPKLKYLNPIHIWKF